MGKSIRETFKMGRHMDKECIYLIMGIDTWASTSMAVKLVRVFIAESMASIMRAFFRMAN
jgi:hypothetical protein